MVYLQHSLIVKKTELKMKQTNKQTKQTTTKIDSEGAIGNKI